MKSRNHSHQRRLPPALFLAAVIFLGQPIVAEDPPAEDEPTTFAAALAAGKTTLTLRYRFEAVDQDGFDEDAEASTLRTTLSYGSAPYKGFRFFVEAENVTGIPDDDNYNNAGSGSLNNGVRDRPVVADPELTDINQAYLALEIKNIDLKLGRQEIVLENARFVGNVGWRQHHQSFNAFSLDHHSSKRAGFSYYYLDKAHRIFGDSRDMSTHLGHVDLKLGDSNRLTAYGYLLDYEEPALTRLSTATYGLRWAGHRQFDNAKFSHTLEAAQQEDHADNPNEVDADYFLAELAFGTKTLTGTLGYEVLSGSAADGAFSTPLATLHKFNGWADKFLATPANGLEDLYLGLAGSVERFRWKAIYHDFQPESSGDDFGTELDFELTYKTAQGITFGLKGAFYDAEAHATDTDKVWFWTAYKFGR